MPRCYVVYVASPTRHCADVSSILTTTLPDIYLLRNTCPPPVTLSSYPLHKPFHKQSRPAGTQFPKHAMDANSNLHGIDTPDALPMHRDRAQDTFRTDSLLREQLVLEPGRVRR